MADTAQAIDPRKAEYEQKLAEVMAQQQAAIAKYNELFGSGMNGPSDQESPNEGADQKPETPLTPWALPESRGAVQEMLAQDVLARNVLNYKAANTCYLDAINVAKTMGIYEDVKDKIAPFPSHARSVNIITSPTQPTIVTPPPAPAPTAPVSTGKSPEEVAENRRFKRLKLAVIALALMGSGVGAAFGLEKMFGFMGTPEETQDEDSFSFDPDEVSIQVF